MMTDVPSRHVCKIKERCIVFVTIDIVPVQQTKQKVPLNNFI